MGAGAERIGLGTAQFGLDYGITNQAGQVSETAVAQILSAAREAGIGLLDTAPLYGESEAAIGAAGACGFAIVSKTPKFAGNTDGGIAANLLESTLRQSLRRLGVLTLHGLLFHDPADLLGAHGPRLWDRMERMKSAGLVARIGVSIYSGDELDRVIDRFPIDIVQVPLNAVDRRLEEGGQLSRLAQSGVETHVRSLFLQGLLLGRPDDIPARFPGLREAVAGIDRACVERGLSRQEGLLAAVMRHSVVSRLICGVTSINEVNALLVAADRAAAVEDFDVPTLPKLDERVLNPARWPELGAR